MPGESKSSVGPGEPPVNIAEKLYELVKEIVGGDGLTYGNIVSIVLSLTQAVEQYGSLNGGQKKAMVLETLNRFISDQVRNPREATELKLLVQLTLPVVIDTFVSIDKREIMIKMKKGLSKLFICCEKSRNEN